jgi:hypothetical protein
MLRFGKKLLKAILKPLVTAGKDVLRRFVTSVLYDEVDHLAPIIHQVYARQHSTEPQRQSYYERTRDIPALKQRFIASGVPVQDASVDIAEFEQWLQDFDEINQKYRTWRDVYIEKCLEHYLAFLWTGLTPDDVYIDIAASGSNWVDVLNSRGYQAYRLDISYAPGIQGCNIGADAGNTGLPDGFATALSLQCAYETFQGDADVRFIHEAKRILNENGRFAILPLYTDDTYCIISSPYANLTNVPLDSGAIRVWREDRHKEPFSRHYSPEAFASRIYSQLDGLQGTLIHFTNLDELETRYPGQRVYCHFMFYCKK